MSDGDRFVFDAPAYASTSVYSSEPLPERLVVVADDAIMNAVNGDSMPNNNDSPVTIAALETVHRGRCIGLAYLVELDP